MTKSKRGKGGNGGNGVDSESEFLIYERGDPTKLSASWRLASVEEAEKEAKRAPGKGIVGRLLYSQDSARLLDGFIDRGKILKEYKQLQCDRMLAIKEEESRKRPSDGSFPEKLYEGIQIKSFDRRASALFFSCEDHNTEVILWVLRSLETDSTFDHLMQCLKTTLSGDRTVLHYTVDQPYLKQYEPYAIEIAKLLLRFKSGKELVKTKDEQKRTALHYAAYHGCIKLCQFLIEKCELRVDEEDREGENVFHIAVDRNNIELVRNVFEWDKESSKSTVISSADSMGKTPLHKAAANGNEDIVRYLVDSFKETPQASCVSQNSHMDYVRQSDMYGQTALQEATRKGHTNVVKYLLQKGSRPLHERDADGKTVLHYAVQLPYEKAKELIDSLTEKMPAEDKYILVSASASGVGTATQNTMPEIAYYVQQKKEELEKTKPQLKQEGPLLLMVKAGHNKMALELVNSGANVEDLRHKNLEDPQQHVKEFLDLIDKIPERGTDQPAREDSLGRSAFAEGLAALFLNPFVKSPFTVGIFGSWGMGKSSIMRQTEILLLKEASQLAFPDLLEVNSIPGSEQFERPHNCYYKKLRLAITSLTKAEQGLVDFLNNYKEKHDKVYRFLALMDRRQLFTKKHSLAKIPSILTVWYNAWHYQKDMEAWAGLAVRITEAIEATMTTAQRIMVSCKYVWKQQRSKILLQLLLPCLLALVSAGLVAWVAWSVLTRSKVKEVEALKYGSIPLSTVVIVWTVVKQLLSVIKPISDQVMGYLQSNHHNENLGYQQKVIDDIEYLKNEIKKEPCWVWKFMAWTWHLLHLRLFGDTVAGTWIPKSHSASHHDGHLRIIVFVDDLDRCEDSVILQVLSAVNLVLAACKIDVVLGVDKEMLERAIANKFGNNINGAAENVKDLPEKYISKIIQLPLALPDPDDTETGTFLKQQMGPALAFEDNDEQQKGSASQGTDGGTDPNVNKPQSSAGVEEKDKQKGVQQAGATDHVVLQCPPKRVGGFLAKIWEFFCPGISHSSIKLTCTRESEHVQGKRLKNLTLMQCYMPNLSGEEQRALLELQKVATDSRRLPREWKRFLTYHRLAWNILSKKDEIKTLSGWHVQLVVWTFCCWQWKHQISAIIEKWESIVSVVKPTKDIEEHKRPSLRSIVNHHVQNEEQNAKKAEGQNEDKSTFKKKDWVALLNTLTKYDVSMTGIHCFQDFRLYCKVGRLQIGYRLQDYKLQANWEDK